MIDVVASRNHQAGVCTARTDVKRDKPGDGRWGKCAHTHTVVLLSSQPTAVIAANVFHASNIVTSRCRHFVRMSECQSNEVMHGHPGTVDATWSRIPTEAKNDIDDGQLQRCEHADK